jgi:superfamily II DNA or RNA helicase
VIVDEAHHLRNRTTQAWKFASELQKQFILLLTATPVQNNLEELFNLVTLLEPGLLSTAKQFQRRFVDRRDKLTPAARRRAARAAGRGHGAQPAEHRRPAVHPPLGAHRAADALGGRTGAVSAT